MGIRLYVGNLPYETVKADLVDCFAKIGAVEACDIITDPWTEKCRGFAFVEMSTKDEANQAIMELNDQSFQGRRLRVNEAKPRKPKEHQPRQNRW